MATAPTTPTCSQARAVKLVWSPRAKRDLAAIADFIALDDPVDARRWIDRLRDRARRAAVVPRSGHKLPELDRDHLREVFVRSYRVIYQVGTSTIIVLAVVEGHLSLDDELA
jgi:toxin ParE1/3/4